MSNKFHKDLVLDDIHALVARTYADITARDADTTFNADATNINKDVRVDSPLAFYTLASIGPAEFVLSGALDPVDTLSEVLAIGNTSDGTDLIISTGDDLLVADHMSVGALSAPATDTSIDLKAIDAAFLLNRLTTAQRDALTAVSGMVIFHIATGRIETFNGTEWLGVPGIDDVLAQNQVLTAARILDVGFGALTVTSDSGPIVIVTFNGPAFSRLEILNSELRFTANNAGGGQTQETLFQSGIWQINATVNYTFGDGFGGNMPVINSDTNDAILFLSAGGGVLGRANAFAFRSLSASGAPVDGTTVAWFVGQLYIDTATSIEYFATSKSSDPDSAGTGSVWLAIESATVAGDVVGPGSATDNAVALFDGITGKLIKDSVTLTFDIPGQQLSLPDGSITLESLEFGDSTRQSSGVPLVDINWTVTDIKEINTQDLSAEIDVPRSLFISRDGLKLYVGDNTSQSIFEYDLGAPFDLSTAPVFTGNSVNNGLNFTGGRLKNDGTRLYVLSFSGDFREYTLSTPFDLSTAGAFTTRNTAAAATNAFFVSDDGRDLFFGDNVGVLTHWTMSAPWDFSTLFDTGTSFSSGLSWLNGAGLSFRSDGRKLILSDGPNSAFVEYSLDIPWDITTTRLIKSQVVGTANYGELFISPDGEKAYSMGITSDLIREFQLFFDITGFSKIAPTTVEIFSAADLTALATADVITVADFENLTIDLKSDLIFSPVRFVLEGSAELRLVSMNADAEWGYTGTGTFISGNAFRVSIENLVLFATVTEDFVDLTAGDFSVQNTAIIGFDSLGAMNGNSFVLRFSDIIDVTNGMDLFNTRLDAINARFINTPATGAAFLLTSTIGVAHDLDLNILDMPVGTFLVRYDPGNIAPGVLNASINTINAGGLFDTTGGTTGTFTAVANAAVASTTIDSVTDSAGTARFNFTVGPTLFVNQQIVNVGFVTNTAYNGTHIVGVVGAGFFEVVTIPFGTDEASGSFTSDSVTLTDTGTTLSDGDSLVIDTDGSTDYDNGAVVYNQLTNTFQISRTFTVTHTGNWDTAGVDQTDPRVLAFQNPGFAASQYVATAFVNDNSTDVGTITNNDFKDMVFGTGGSALVAGSTIERWKLINEIDGTFEYRGNEPFSGYITFDYSVVSSGGTVEFRFKWQKDTGGGFADLTNDVEALVDVGSTAQSVTKTFPITASLGDQIKPQLTRNSGSSGLTIRYATIFATQSI